MKIYFIGAGPGDPELITVKGLRLIEEADVILYADSLVNEQLFENRKRSAKIIKTAGMHLEEIVNVMVKKAKEGKKVVRVHTGDPAVYGAIMEQISLLKKEEIEVEIIPGVSSVFAAAARVGTELTIPELTQTVILTRAEGRTPVPELEKLKDLAKHHCTVALFLSATLTKKIVAEFIEAGWDEQTPVAVVYKATWPDEKIVRTTLKNLDEEMKANGIRKHAMILAGWALDEQIYNKDYRSKLYDQTFTHGYRKGVEIR
ncbi:precorrin-4 C(11)-methyltransferase [Calidifontibacillus erzurumensis]|uniref:precorrin-4 C(11)-methyltransferase n=1 Tax=Calidifontibacillus erzurumensis TaxID=2741433 RepID=UPI0035B53E4A